MSTIITPSVLGRINTLSDRYHVLRELGPSSYSDTFYDTFRQLREEIINDGTLKRAYAPLRQLRKHFYERAVMKRLALPSLISSLPLLYLAGQLASKQSIREYIPILPLLAFPVGTLILTSYFYVRSRLTKSQLEKQFGQGIATRSVLGALTELDRTATGLMVHLD